VAATALRVAGEPDLTHQTALFWSAAICAAVPPTGSMPCMARLAMIDFSLTAALIAALADATMFSGVLAAT